ncbi:Nif3-like dinuclear metal center hexameric protein [Oceanirhabdus sp. W0125-5]|uniref:Nif3-like dinuclear metal center hexameric protein n=1 Tax=Oceanirhabdus sp. W0125-5 TaxID=2999116 RepID=UPI0022F2D052|nr:Nif3-like dinuclear metal center hexameric protein [Oceanirhabdus sp. W0125-5]WBW95758.1 Nif3-like dinuclear metal center hexameric protein [Oceanirhabdus sp. W0125-5]
MSFSINDFHKRIMKDAPAYMKESYDNIGLMVGDKNQEIRNILVSLDCTKSVIEEAKAKGCNLIFNHHPILFLKPKKITTDTLQGEKLLSLIKNDIAVYSAHTNLDSAPKGLNKIACELAVGNEGELLNNVSAEDYGIGRIGDLDSSVSFEEYIESVKKIFEIEKVRVCGDLNKKVKRIAIINGSGQDFILSAIEKGADCIITGDTTFHYISDYNEMGVCIIDGGHFEIEWKIFKEYCQELKKELGDNGFEGELLFSERCVNPYQYK